MLLKSDNIWCMALNTNCNSMPTRTSYNVLVNFAQAVLVLAVLAEPCSLPELVNGIKYMKKVSSSRLICWLLLWGPNVWIRSRAPPSAALCASSRAAAEEPGNWPADRTWPTTAQHALTKKSLHLKRIHYFRIRVRNCLCNNCGHTQTQRQRKIEHKIKLKLQKEDHASVPENWLCEHSEGLDVDPGHKHFTEIHFQPAHEGSLVAQNMLLSKELINAADRSNHVFIYVLCNSESSESTESFLM